MATIDRAVIVWTGFPGAPGYSTFYAAPGGAVLSMLRDFFEGIKGMLPSSVHITFPSTGDQINDDTGELVGSWSGSTPTPVDGTSVVGYTAPAGICVNWNTSGIVRGRRVRGRTFLVPVVADEPDGTPAPLTVSTINTQALLLVSSSAGALKIWSRPVNGVGGTSHSVNGAMVRDSFSVLRSRRD